MFTNKTVLIIGASGGIGSIVSKEISKKGGKLILVARNKERLQKLKKELPGEVLIFSADATISSDLSNVVKKGIEKFGKIDSLIHCVGSIIIKPIHSLKEEEFRETLELNLVTPFLAIKSIIKHMMKQKNGSIVVISSVAGTTGLSYHEAISAAKGGLEAMIRSAAISYAKRGIRFNAVALGLVDTPLAQPYIDNELNLKASINLHPLGRIGKPEDIVNAILYFASDNSLWTTGSILHVDGGISAGK